MMLNDKWCKIVGGRPRKGFLWTLGIYAIFSFATELGSRGKSVNIVSGTRVSLRDFYHREKYTNCVKKLGDKQQRSLIGDAQPEVVSKLELS